MKSDVELFEALRISRGMYLSSDSYEELIALILGFDLGRSGGPLMGFKEWLVFKHQDGANLQWGRLVLEMCRASKGEDQFNDPRTMSREVRQFAADELLRLILEFLKDREQRGLRAVYLDFQQWLEGQSWYGPDLPDWYQPSHSEKRQR